MITYVQGCPWALEWLPELLFVRSSESKCGEEASFPLLTCTDAAMNKLEKWVHHSKLPGHRQADYTEKSPGFAYPWS